MALSFIGKPISLISHSDVRYRGVLAGIDPQASTIQLSNVYSMGTESRRPPEHFIPPVQEPYAYIIFRASEVKDLAVDEPQPRRSVHDDPAVLGASAPIVQQGAYPYPPGGPYQQSAGQPQQAQGTPSPQSAQAYAQAPTQGTPPAQSAVPQNGAQTIVAAASAAKPERSTAVNSATASLESVERALGDLRVNGGGEATDTAINNGRGGHGGGRRGGRRHETKQSDLRVPTTDFDFESANARFDKAALSPNKPPKSGEVTPQAETEEDEEEEQKVKAKEAAPIAYNPKKSFFDSLSSGSNGPSSEGRGRGGGRRGGGGRNRREEERERNVATFGEPGGIGLMGPGAYVGGWGGYGRRGGRGRRSGGAPTNSRQ